MLLSLCSLRRGSDERLFVGDGLRVLVGDGLLHVCGLGGERLLD
jgi:hypothetical protein